MTDSFVSSIRRGASQAALAFVPLLTAACGSGGDGGAPGGLGFPGNDGGSLADGAAADAGKGDAKAEPDGGSGPPPFVSNPPGAMVTDVGMPPTPDFVLLSLNFLQRPSGGQYFQEWLGEVMNVGTTTACLLRLDIAYKDAGGGVIVPAFTTYADADPYQLVGTTSKLSTACIAPGKIGSFYNNGFANTQTPTAGIKTIAVKFSPLLEQVVPDPNAPTVSAHVVPTAGSFYGLQGSVVAGAGTVNNIGVHAYPRDASGLVLGQLVEADLGTLTPGQSWPFMTAGVSTPFTEFRIYADYIEGAGMFVPALSVADARLDKIERLELERRRTAAEVRARAERARPQRPQE
jgi:hypothetical protein